MSETRKKNILILAEGNEEKPYIDKILSFPEMKFFNNTSLNNEEKYKFFYFQNIEPRNLINDVKGIILLHNSWTPLKYKSMSEEEFLAQDIFLSKLLKKILQLNEITS